MRPLLDLRDYIHGRPRLLREMGSGLMLSAFAFTIAGLFGNVAKTAVSAMNVLSRPASKGTTLLAFLYPDLPTWWIPESALTFVMLLGVAGCGLVLCLEGRKLERLMRL